jgi:hypothetical protein
MIKEFLWFFVFTGGFASLIFIYKGSLKNIKEGSNFELKQLFKETPFNESSGTLLIIEGIFGLFCMTGLIYALFNWF